MILKHKILFLAIAALVFGSSCSKDRLDLPNPNSPGLVSLNTEEGMLRAGLGVYSKFGLEYFWLAQTSHNAMGENVWTSVGNFSWRWVNQPTSITLSNATVLLPPVGGAQGKELKDRNTRAFGNDNVFFNEWAALYLVNNQCNLILQQLNSPSLTFSGSAAAVVSKKATLKAWAYWWKAFAYSRIGSLYVAGIITDKLNESNNEFKSRQEMIAEAANNFDKCIAALGEVTDVAAYTATLDRFIPSMTKVGKGGVFTIAEWKRHINTYKARNILVNKKADDVTLAEWNSILALTQDGLLPTDKILTMRSADANAIVANTNGPWTPFRVLTNAWEFLTERWVQEFKPGDARRTRNVVQRATTVVNNSGRGFQYGTRWALKDISAGGDYASQITGLAELPMGCTYEENALTRAEALIRTGAIEDGLLLIDAVRVYQNALLPAVAGTGLTLSQAKEELYRERRIGLFLKNTPFYDYRRFGFACKDCARTGAVVVGPGGVIDNNATIIYNYMDYWDVPLNELDFNTPSATSSPVVFPF